MGEGGFEEGCGEGLVYRVAGGSREAAEAAPVGVAVEVGEGEEDFGGDCGEVGFGGGGGRGWDIMEGASMSMVRIWCGLGGLRTSKNQKPVGSLTQATYQEKYPSVSPWKLIE